MTPVTARILVNGQEEGGIPASDRGLCYGDGVFTTIRYVAGMRAPLLDDHLQKLADDAARLGLPMPDQALLRRELQQVVADMEDGAIVRLTLTRGIGERGYAPPSSPRPTRIVAAFAPPSFESSIYLEGVSVRLCDLRLGEQPALAGLKHLNRLEQVIARAEWSDPAIFEGLLCDAAGHVVDGTMSNLFAVIGGQVLTPRLDRCGVSGVARGRVCRSITVVEGELTLDELGCADELFLTSSVRGILPIRAVDDRVFRPGPVTRALQALWRDLGFTTEMA